MDFEAKKFAGENLAFSILCRNRHAPKNSKRMTIAKSMQMTNNKIITLISINQI
jgi:hypothetical protein